MVGKDIKTFEMFIRVRRHYKYECYVKNVHINKKNQFFIFVILYVYKKVGSSIML